MLRGIKSMGSVRTEVDVFNQSPKCEASRSRAALTAWVPSARVGLGRSLTLARLLTTGLTRPYQLSCVWITDPPTSPLSVTYG